MSLRLIRRPGRPYWYIHGTVRGLIVRESTGVADETAAEEIRAKREWELIQRSIHGAQATATFLEAAVSYMEAGGENRYLSPLIARIGKVPLGKIDQDLVDKVARSLCPDHANSTLVRTVYTPISAVMHHAAKRKMGAAPKFERPKQPPGRIRWITFEEAERLIDACAPHLRALVTFLLGTGARKAEAAFLDWRNVDLVNAQVNFVNDDDVRTKSGQSRGVPLHPRVLAELLKLPHRDGAVFRTHLGKPYGRGHNGSASIEHGFMGACRRAGITNFSPHDCRHTWATWHYAANRDLFALMQLGGWKSLEMVKRYAHVNVTQLAPTIDAALLHWGRPGTRTAPKLRVVKKRHSSQDVA
jgi:integrase